MTHRHPRKHLRPAALILKAALTLTVASWAFATPSEGSANGNAANSGAENSGSANSGATNGASAPSGGSLPFLPEAETPPVARDVGVAELPLLVTEPPEEETQTTIPDPVTGGADSGLNPFAPLVFPQQPAQPAPQPPAVTEQPAPAPDPAPTVESAPPPAEATAPAAPVPEVRAATPGIPRALTDLMKPATGVGPALPGILESSIATPSTAPADPLTEMAAIRTPPVLPPLSAAPTMVGTAMVGTATQAATSSAQAVARQPGLAPMSLSGTMLGSDENATFGLSNRVSRSLAELRVSFTAMTTGTGIFRVGDSGRPVLVAVGDSLPGTGLILSDLTARGAQFTEDDVRHTLLLNP